jgi:mannose-1-phosphate guanylyltransferase
VRNALPFLDDTTIVFNGDVLTDVDLPAVVAEHRAAGARATLVLAPVPNPAAYGLVETDEGGRVRRFVEKPEPSQITTDTINAGIYVLDTATLERMPAATPVSIERVFFPGLLADGLHMHGFVHRRYWIDIGTPEKYLQVHRDILGGAFPVALAGLRRDAGWVDPSAEVAEGARLEGPFYVGPGCRVARAAVLGRGAVLTSGVTVREEAEVADSVLWPGTDVGPRARVEGALLGGVSVGAHARVGPGSVLGEGTRVTDHSRMGA